MPLALPASTAATAAERVSQVVGSLLAASLVGSSQRNGGLVHFLAARCHFHVTQFRIRHIARECRRRRSEVAANGPRVRLSDRRH